MKACQTPTAPPATADVRCTDLPPAPPFSGTGTSPARSGAWTSRRHPPTRHHRRRGTTNTHSSSIATGTLLIPRSPGIRDTSRASKDKPRFATHVALYAYVRTSAGLSRRRPAVAALVQEAHTSGGVPASSRPRSQPDGGPSPPLNPDPLPIWTECCDTCILVCPLNILGQRRAAT